MGKTIVMSDLHVSNCEEYAWCSVKGVAEICTMLEWVAHNPTVSELVLLGDVFDFWVYPVDVVPWTAKQIISIQGRLVSALRECVTRIPDVFYLVGNHDMGVTAADLEAFAVGSKKILLKTPDEYAQKHQLWRLQHGHEVDMFNAPYDLQDGIGGLPFGYFITRMATHSRDPQKALELVHDAVKGHISLAKLGMLHQPGLSPLESDFLGKEMVKTIVDVLAVHAGLPQTAVIRFSDPVLDAQGITIEKIKLHYAGLLGLWWRTCKGNPEELLDCALVSRRANGLDWYANQLKKSSASVIVMGHTHHAETVGDYANDGCWCHSTGETYVVIENDVATVVPY